MTWQGAGGAGESGDPASSGALPGPPPAQPPAPPQGPPPGPPPFGTGPGPAFGAPGPATVGWAPPTETTSRYGVPGAPALVFAGALPRFVAFLIDGLLLGFVSGLLSYGLLGATLTSTGVALATTVVTVGLEFLYFVGLWTSGGRATLGMRLLHLQVGNAADGRKLDVGQAVRRWVGLGMPLSLVGLVPSLAAGASGLSLLWWIALLISTVVSPTKQGLHDRFADSAVVRPVGAGDGAVILGCLILVAAAFLLPIVALIFLGGQVSTILSQAGASV